MMEDREEMIMNMYKKQVEIEKIKKKWRYKIYITMKVDLDILTKDRDFWLDKLASHKRGNATDLNNTKRSKE